MNVKTLSRIALTAVILAAGFVDPASAQRGGPPGTARETAPIDLTGTWVSIVSEDWRHRIATPRRGDYESLPISQAGRRAADAWDLAADNAAGMQCRAFGVGGIIRQPGRLNIDWENDNTLRIDFDAGTQTRLLHFDANARPGNDLTWQGHSIAMWERPPAQRGGSARAQIGNIEGPVAPGGGGRGQRGGPAPSATIYEGGSMTVTTTNFLSGYLRKNGVPYSEDASITEYFHVLPPGTDGDTWLLVITVIEDPTYLNGPFYTSTHFKREPNDAKFNPTECRTAPPP